MPTEPLDLVRAFSPLLRLGDAFSHFSAAVVHHLRMPEGFSARPIHVTTFDGGRPMRRSGVSAHRGGTRCARSTVVGLPVTDPVDTWLHLAALLDPDDLVVVGDGLVRRWRPLVTLEELGARLVGHDRFVGAERARAALALVRAGTDSARETMLRLLIVRAGFEEPVPNAPIRNEFGAVIAHGDLVWREARVILEYEGDHHRTDKRQFSIDIDRIGALQALGWKVIRVDAALLARPRVLIERVRQALAQA